MTTRLISTALPLITPAAYAADLPPAPAASIARKKELLFSDDFESATPAKPWHRVVDTFVFEKGALKGMQTRDKNIPATDGKPAITAHAAVHGLEIPTRDSVVEVKIRLEGATMMDVEFDDRKYTGSHYGHLCRAQVRTNGVRSEEHTSELQSPCNLVCRLLLEKKTINTRPPTTKLRHVL